MTQCPSGRHQRAWASRHPPGLQNPAEIHPHRKKTRPYVLANYVRSLRDSPQFTVRKSIGLTGPSKFEVTKAVLRWVRILQKSWLVRPYREAALNQPITVLFLFGTQETQPIDSKLRVPEVEAAQRPACHHLPTLFDNVHLATEPKTHQLSDVLLIGKGLGRYRRVVLIAGLGIFKEPVFGIPGTPAPLFFFECGF